MNIEALLQRALDLDFLSIEEGVFLFENAPTALLMEVGNALRQKKVPGDVVTWIIDRNSNTTNVCNANCKCTANAATIRSCARRAHYGLARLYKQVTWAPGACCVAGLIVYVHIYGTVRGKAPPRAESNETAE